jgi:hypothetical protein
LPNLVTLLTTLKRIRTLGQVFELNFNVHLP